jgi:hypothetical protein
MANGDRIVDNRWRPDLISSQRRVREEEFEESLPDGQQPEVIFSRELSFVPARRRVFEAHDAQTRALIRRLAELERLPHGEPVGKLLEHWKWLGGDEGRSGEAALAGAADRDRAPRSRG